MFGLFKKKDEAPKGTPRPERIDDETYLGQLAADNADLAYKALQRFAVLAWDETEDMAALYSLYRYKFYNGYVSRLIVGEESGKREWTEAEGKLIVRSVRLLLDDDQIVFAVQIDSGKGNGGTGWSAEKIERIRRFGRSGWDNGTRMAIEMNNDEEYSEENLTHLFRLMETFKELRGMDTA